MRTPTPPGRTSAVPFRARIPGSKACTLRALVLAAQRPGTTRVEGGLRSDDTDLLARALGSFEGLEVEALEQGFDVTRTRAPLGAPRSELDLGGAGAAARFVLACAAAAEGATVVTGKARLRERPMADLFEALGALGIRIEALGRPGHLPVRVHGGAIEPRVWRVRAGVSSQFTSALCLLAARQPAGPVRIELEGQAVSRPYVDLTLAMMSAHGVRAERDGADALVVHPATPSSAVIPVEVDASSASYLLAAAAVTGTAVEVPGLGLGSHQGDVGFARVLERMGCRLEPGRDSIALAGGPLSGVEVDLCSMPDVALTLAAVAAVARGPTRITNVASLRVKESDRIAAAARALERLGAGVEEGPDWLAIHPRGGERPADRLLSASIDTRDDHRVAMAFAVLGLVAPGIEIRDPGCVAKSFPGFWTELERFAAHHAAG